MKARSWPGRLLHAGLTRLSLHHIAYQATMRGYRLTDEDDEDDDDDPYRSAFDTFEFDEAAASLRRGDVAEALFWLECGLPDSFAGLADQVQPREVRP